MRAVSSSGRAHARHLHPRVLAVSVLAALFLLLATSVESASAFERKHVNGPFSTPELAMGPPNKEYTDVKPGDVLKLDVFVQNRLNVPIDIQLEAKDAEGSANPASLIDVVRASKYGAGDWIHVENPRFHLESGDTLIQKVTIRVPPDVGGGSWYAAVQASTLFRSPSGAIQLDRKAGLNSIILIDMAGAVHLGGRIRDISSGRFATHGAGAVVPLEAIWQNTGNVTDAVRGKVRVKSIFGTTALTTSFKSAIVVRGGTREFRTVWDEVPWIGLFRPQVELTGRDGKTHTRTYPYVLVLPPWYYILAVVMAALLPLWRWWANRRKWNRLMAELYGDDEDDWDDDDEWDHEV